MSRNRFFLAFGISLSVLTTGCMASSADVSQENAVEAAIDDTGYTEDEVSDIKAEDMGGYYSVSFATPKGTFAFEINKNGIIKSRSFEKTEEPAREPETKPVSKTPDEQEDQEQNRENEIRQRALTAAVNNIGVTEADITDPNVAIDGDTAEVTFDLAGNRWHVTVNTTDFQAVSTWYE